MTKFHIRLWWCKRCHRFLLSIADSQSFHCKKMHNLTVLIWTAFALTIKLTVSVYHLVLFFSLLLTTSYNMNWNIEQTIHILCSKKCLTPKAINAWILYLTFVTGNSMNISIVSVGRRISHTYTQHLTVYRYFSNTQTKCEKTY